MGLPSAFSARQFGAISLRRQGPRRSRFGFSQRHPRFQRSRRSRSSHKHQRGCCRRESAAMGQFFRGCQGRQPRVRKPRCWRCGGQHGAHIWLLPIPGDIGSRPGNQPRQVSSGLFRLERVFASWLLSCGPDNGVCTKLTVTKHTGFGRLTYLNTNGASTLLNVERNVRTQRLTRCST